MSLSRRMKKAALRANLKAAANKNGASNSQFGKAIEEQEDSYLANILGSINKSSFMKKVLYNAIGLTLMATTPASHKAK